MAFFFQKKFLKTHKLKFIWNDKDPAEPKQIEKGNKDRDKHFLASKHITKL